MEQMYTPATEWGPTPLMASQIFDPRSLRSIANPKVNNGNRRNLRDARLLAQVLGETHNPNICIQ